MPEILFDKDQFKEVAECVWRTNKHVESWAESVDAVVDRMIEVATEHDWPSGVHSIGTGGFDIVPVCRYDDGRIRVTAFVSTDLLRRYLKID